VKKRYAKRPSMVKLSVNINKIATLRNARGETNPNVLKAALDIESYGADGITVHPRPDGRHIRFSDVFDLKKNIKVELNIEGYPSHEYIKLVSEIKPAQATLVPDPPEALTSDAGWNVKKNEAFLSAAVQKLKPSGARISLFIDPLNVSTQELAIIKSLGIERIELYTKLYADVFHSKKLQETLEFYKKVAREAEKVGLGVNAGHDLDLKNLGYLVRNIPELLEVSIGHALICDALNFGLKDTVQKYLLAAKG